jgi:hypothetical protein
MAHTEGMNFRQFQERFTSEADCQRYLYQIRWPDSFICPKCGCRRFSYINSRGGKYQCSGCHHQTSLTSGTVMHRTHLPLTVWFAAIYFVARDKRGISALQLSSELDIGYESAWYLLKRIRKAMADRDQRYLLDGITEMDDFYYGGPGEGGKRGRGTTQESVMIAVSKTEDGKPKFVKMQVVKDLKGGTVKDFALSHIATGSTIQSDSFSSYKAALGKDYTHDYTVYDSDSDMLHWLHMIVGNAKAFLLGTYHGNCRHDLQPFLDEFCFRLNRRSFKEELFTRLLHAVVQPNILGCAVLS